MGIIIKKFNQYIKEDINSLRQSSNAPSPDYDFDEEYPGNGEGIEDPSDLIDNDEDIVPGPVKLNYIENEYDGVNFEDQEEEIEEPGYEGGRMLLDLAKKLRSKVINNEINYNGQIITCYSEDNKFRIGDQIIGKNVEEAYRNIQAGKNVNKFEDEFEQSPSFENEFVQESKSSKKKNCKCNCCENCSQVMNQCKCSCKNCKCRKKK